jgi:hypothetical protein
VGDLGLFGFAASAVREASHAGIRFQTRREGIVGACLLFLPFYVFLWFRGVFAVFLGVLMVLSWCFNGDLCYYAFMMFFLWSSRSVFLTRVAFVVMLGVSYSSSSRMRPCHPHCLGV